MLAGGPLNARATLVDAARLTLPVKPTALLSLLNGESNDRSLTGDGKEAKPDRPLQGLEILVVEDNPINQTFARLLLDKLGARVTIAGDGEFERARAASAWWSRSRAGGTARPRPGEASPRGRW